MEFVDEQVNIEALCLAQCQPMLPDTAVKWPACRHKQHCLLTSPCLLSHPMFAGMATINCNENTAGRNLVGSKLSVNRGP